MDFKVNSTTKPSSFWVSWLTLVITVTAVSSLVPVLAPELAQHGFSLLVFADLAHIATFDDEAIRYIRFVHGVLGAVMFGWMILLLTIVRHSFSRGERRAWIAITVSVLAWFLPGTGFSAWLGIWQNVALNLGFVALFVIPLAATFKVFYKEQA